MDHLRKLKALCFWLLSRSLILVVAAPWLSAGTRDKAARPGSESARDPSKYVGADTCQGCHPEVYKQFETTPHWKTLLDTRRGKDWQGCEACHGPGTDHVNAGGGKGTMFNTFQLEYDFSKRIGARIGHRYRLRTITQQDTELQDALFYPKRAARGTCAPLPDGSPSPDCTALPDGSYHAVTAESDSAETVINEHSLLVELWARSVDALRPTSDLEFMSPDKAFTRISPRQLQRYKLRATYKAANWASLGAFFNIYEARNNVADVGHLQHSRSYGFNTTIAPNDRWSLDMGYDYNSVFSHTNICFIFGFGLPPPGFPPCPVLGSPVPLQAISIYNNRGDFAYGDFMVRPIKRLTLNMGYSLNTVSGNTLILNPNSFPGPLRFSYSKPYASAAVDLVKGWTWKTAWGFNNYREQADPFDPTAPRSFRGNLLTLSVRYSF
jgi:hypothetical protein